MKNKLSKTEESAIKSRIDTIVNKYGYDGFRQVASKYIDQTRLKNKLKMAIKTKEEELRKLKSKK